MKTNFLKYMVFGFLLIVTTFSLAGNRLPYSEIKKVEKCADQGNLACKMEYLRIKWEGLDGTLPVKKRAMKEKLNFFNKNVAPIIEEGYPRGNIYYGIWLYESGFKILGRKLIKDAIDKGYYEGYITLAKIFEKENKNVDAFFLACAGAVKTEKVDKKLFETLKKLTLSYASKDKRLQSVIPAILSGKGRKSSKYCLDGEDIVKKDVDKKYEELKNPR